MYDLRHITRAVMGDVHRLRHRIYPIHLIVLLHHYTVDEPYSAHNPGHAKSESATEAHACLLEKGLLELDTRRRGGYSVTERGRVYIEALCLTPLPEKRVEWVMP